MPNFPRAAKALPRLASPPRFPQAMGSWGASGKGQLRSVMNMGRTWTETYPLMDSAQASVRALMESINRSMRQPVLWDVQHPYWHKRMGLAGGTPLVNAGGQTGSSLIIDGASAGITGWLKQGDLVKVAGCPVIFDVTADVNTDGSGNATIPIHPPIFVGRSPVDNAVVTIDPTAIFFKAYIVDVQDFPQMDVTRYIEAGLTLTWREQPQ
jgi:hypothetical protein